MEDEEEALELYEAYEEARQRIDEEIPRSGPQQSQWLYDNLTQKGDDFFIRWIDAHETLWNLKSLISD